MVLREGLLVERDNSFLNFEIEGDSREGIDSYNKKTVYLIKLFC